MLAFGKKTRVSGRLFALLLRSAMNCRGGEAGRREQDEVPE